MIGNLHFVMGKITHWSSLIYRTAMTRGISIGSQTEGNPSCWKEIHDNDTCMYRNMIKTWSAFVRFDDHSPYRPPVAVLGPCVQDVHPLAAHASTIINFSSPVGLPNLSQLFDDFVRSIPMCWWVWLMPIHLVSGDIGQAWVLKTTWNHMKP